jgi:nucleoside phosphorylase
MPQKRLQTNNRNLPRAGILTTQAAGWEAVCAHLTEQRDEVHPEGTIYRVGLFLNDKGTWEVAVAEIGKGNNSAAVETERIINFFRPEVAFFVGFAGGLKDVSIGDVIASTKIYGIESGKAHADLFELRPSVGNAAYRLEQRAKVEARVKNWLKRLKGEVPFPEPRAVVGPIATGEKIVASKQSEIVRFVKANYGDALAMETEGRGFLEAVRANHSVTAIVIRGVSNLLDDKQEAEVRGSKIIAANHAAAFTFEVLAKLDGRGNGRSRKPAGAAKRKPATVSEVRQPPVAAAAPRASEFESNPDGRIKVTTIESLYSVLTSSTYAVKLLGGGASVKSGVSLSDGLVEKAVRWQYCRDKGLSFDDPRVVLRLSDWMPEFRKQPWYKEGPLADNFPQVMRHVLQPRDNRREFFRHILDTNVPASSGYERLAEFMALGFVMTALTTNFDPVLAELCHRRRRPHYVDVINSESTRRLLTTSPRYPLITYLYGSIEDYIDRFEEDEPRRLDPALVQRLIPILRDHPLIVIGYRGAEEVIMRHLLIEQIEAVEHYHQGIYWCVQNYRDSGDLHPLVQEFAGLVRGNFQVVPIEGFDEMMEQLWGLHQRHQHRATATHVQIPPVEATSDSPTFDLAAVDADLETEIDWANLKTRLVNYCDVWEIPVPEVVTREWLVEELCRQHLAIISGDGKVQPTRAGYLLFGRKPHERIPASIVLLRVRGEEEQRIEGSLWNQLASITDALAEVNKPFLLKAEKSETVYPYPPTALREVIVNALVHREYDSPNNIVVDIELDRIRLTNPGGLVEEVMRQTEGGSILSQIEQGIRGIKGYRNPVIADLFYSSHDMEKAGSGLADVHRLVKENGGKVTFGPIKENAAFEVVIHSRPEAVDRQTGTAAVVVSTRYAANLLEIAEMPDRVWQASAPYNRARDVWANTDAPWLPPFIVHGQKIHTFFDLSEEANPLRELVDTETIKSVSLDEFSTSDDGERRLVWLMNECLYKHIESCGLIIDKYRRRAYFPRTEEGNRSVTYQARLRRSSRTVTKPVISPTTQKIRYWEHQSFSFSFERFADTWALQILPSYVFTIEGWREFLSGERVNILSTKRASKDYNSKVHTDLVFWSWVLSSGQQGGFTLRMGPTREELKRSAKRSSGGSKGRKVIGKRGNRLSTYVTGKNNPQFLIRSVLPTLTVYNLEEASDDDNLKDERERAEQAELEDELGALAEEFEEQFDD